MRTEKENNAFLEAVEVLEDAARGGGGLTLSPEEVRLLRDELHRLNEARIAAEKKNG